VHFTSFFCPHGFSYGTSIIKHAEGRKDPFQALYTHLDKAPRNLVYDFACGFAEYALNREPAFFRSTRYLPRFCYFACVLLD
jgi:hypothetical protein